MTIKILLCLAIFLFSFNSAWAYPVGGDPVLLISSGGEGPRIMTQPRDPRDNVTLHGATTFTSSSMNYDASGPGYSQNSYADPLGFQVKNRISAEGGLSYASVDAVGTWFVLTGPDSTVSLTADIAFQGQISASSLTSNAWFTNYLSFASSNTSLISEYLIVQNGLVGSGPISSQLAGTVDDFYQPNPGTYDINEVIRSKPFTVTVGIPFRLGLVLNTTVSDSASIDFFDPEFSLHFFPDGFALEDGDTLASAGYSVQPAVPIPATFLLLGSGLAALVGFRKKFQRS